MNRSVNGSGSFGQTQLNSGTMSRSCLVSTAQQHGHFECRTKAKQSSRTGRSVRTLQGGLQTSLQPGLRDAEASPNLHILETHLRGQGWIPRVYAFRWFLRTDARSADRVCSLATLCTHVIVVYFPATALAIKGFSRL